MYCRNNFVSLFLEWFAERRRRNLKRVDRLKEICEKYPNEIRYENPAYLSKQQFHLEKDFEIMSCSIDKVGPKVRRDLKLPDRKWNKIIFVKEPMERLAWYFHQNKFQRNLQNGSVLRSNFQKRVKS